MSVNEQDQSAPITPGSPLARALAEYAVPGLSAGFADRVLAAAATRPAPLPDLRRQHGTRGWRWGRGIAIGVVSFGVLASAAAATGMLERFAIPVPSAQKVWASLTGRPAVKAVPSPPAPSQPARLAQAKIAGPIDTPEELSEAFRRIDDVRERRRAVRRDRVDQRIASAIERRQAAGLPALTPEEEAGLRAKITAAQARRDQLANDRIATRRDDLQRKVQSGEALTREDIVRPAPEDADALERRERLRQWRGLLPEQQREALRQLPPEERRALIEDYRTRRAGGSARLQQTPVEAETPAQPETPAVPAD